MIRIGPYEICSIETGRFRLDGGSMFGVVPRVVWEPAAPADDKHRIRLSARSLLAIDRDADRAILVDTGVGDKWNAAERDRFGFEIRDDAVDGALAERGLSRDAITDIVVTHLHFDHNGGLTSWKDAPGGDLVPRFPNARHWIHERQLDHARQPNEKDRASFYPRDFEPIAERSLFEIVSGDATKSPFPCIDWFISEGHTPAQLLPRFDDGSQRLLFVGDVIPTFVHLPIAWVMAFDLEPLKTMREKADILRQCAEVGLLLASVHDPDAPAAEIDTAGRRPKVRKPITL